LPAWSRRRQTWSWPRGKDQDDISLPTAAAGAADITNVLFQLTGELPVDGLEDVMVTFRRQLCVIRLVNPEPQILLLVILDRDRVNLAMARREIRAFCASFALGNQPGTISSASRTTCRFEGPGRRTSLSGPGRHPHGPADQWMAKSARVYPSALTVGWMKLFSIIRVACASAALISGPVTFGLCLTCVNARFCAWP